MHMKIMGGNEVNMQGESYHWAGWANANMFNGKSRCKLAHHRFIHIGIYGNFLKLTSLDLKSPEILGLDAN
jgi:hypothetical protein